MKEIQPASPGRGAGEPALPAAVDARVLFLTESFHPVLGGGEQHIRGSGRALAGSGLPADGGDAPRGRALAGARDHRRHPRRPRRARPGAGRGGASTRWFRPRCAALRRAARRATTCWSSAARACWACPALVAARALGKARRAAARGQRRDDGRGLHLGHGARPAAGRGARSSPGSPPATVLLRDGDAFVAMSRAIRDEFLGGRASRREKVALIPHGVDTAPLPARDRRTSARRSGSASGLPADGRDHHLYGPAAARQGARDADRRRSRLIAAAEPSRAPGHRGLRRRARRSPWRTSCARACARPALAGRVTFAGRVDAVEDWLRASDVFAFPSMFEALGIVAGRGRGVRPALRWHRARAASSTSSRTAGRECSCPRATWPALSDRAPSPGRRIRTSARAMGAAARDVALRAVRRARCRRPLSRAVPRGGGTGGPAVRVALTGATGLHRRAAAGAPARRRAPGGGAGPRRRTRCPPAAANGVRWVEGDLRDTDALRRLVDGVDAVVHVAAVYRTAGHPDSYYRDVNVGGHRAPAGGRGAGRRAALRPHLDGRRARRRRGARRRTRPRPSRPATSTSRPRPRARRWRSTTTGGAACPWPWSGRARSTGRARRAC